MSRGQGRVYRRPGADTLWLDYSVGGNRHRESSETTSKREAQDKLRKKIGDRRDGKLIGRPDRVLLAEYEKDADGEEKLVGGLRWLHETQYDLDGLRSKERIQQCWNHVEKFFPAPTRVTAITPTRLDEYAKARLKEGAARQTVNNELSALRRGFSLAIKKGILSTAPKVELPRVQNARSDFFDDGDFAALLLELPAFLQPAIRFLWFTAWRIEEALHLTWDMVDWEGQVIRLPAALAKAKTPRLFPFGSAPDLKALLDAQLQGREGDCVFHQDGRAITYNSAWYWWKQARKRAGLPKARIHDFRRTAARAMRRSGLSEGVIMKLCGWKTRSMFDRYNIIDEADLTQAVAKHFNGTVTAQLTPSRGSRSR
jgi:integrase